MAGAPQVLRKDHDFFLHSLMTSIARLEADCAVCAEAYSTSAHALNGLVDGSSRAAARNEMAACGNRMAKIYDEIVSILEREDATERERADAADRDRKESPSEPAGMDAAGCAVKSQREICAFIALCVLQCLVCYKFFPGLGAHGNGLWALCKLGGAYISGTRTLIFFTTSLVLVVLLLFPVTFFA
jgi:hypothetical protein